MTKIQLIEKAAKDSGMTKKDIAAAFDALYNAFAETVAAGEGVQIAGFGNFAVKERAARTGRNPRTNETIEIPASRYVAFTAGKALKDKLN